ncbi:hypothetical protein MJL30_38810, partial [Salmonella enterica subsp. enterica serovar Anatum]|nr:hypothetical protein [Salmonella enterica subsp. enterica serovar Anatum]
IATIMVLWGIASTATMFAVGPKSLYVLRMLVGITEAGFLPGIKESLWQELADITDKTQLEWREVFQDLNHHGVYHSGEVVGLGN